MAIVISLDQYWELMQEAAVLQHSINSNFEKSWQYSFQLGHGIEKEIWINPHISLSITNYRSKNALVLKLPERKHCLEFCFYLQGSCQISSLGEIKAGESFVFSGGIAPQDCLQHPEREKRLIISIHMGVDYFNRLISPFLSTKNSIAYRLSSPTEDWVYRKSLPINPIIQLVLQQILNCQYQGVTKQLYLEGKILELISLQIDQLDQTHRKSSPKLPNKDIDCIYEASEILLQRLSTPPSLTELAKLVGINDRKLKQGFREVFGTTVFGYLRDRRLEQAQELLLSGQMQVKDAAKTVGYASPTSFNTAFRKKFGIAPSLYCTQKQI
ncbi:MULTISPECIES: AraC family transcriptional regulator [Cyanophyceae]|uniref:AraC family transcriptional regulator n=1 Tax=Cyanophyceae TaxID=3028117 RepID=UPI00016DC370|nr:MULTISPECIES: AraC family transcriptional regulator [Cyanophyceae]ACB01136.1 transcription regulator, AraC family [Picosynechococcus sp. PCC 7002]SMH48231.1 AraC-type DNA-binding protein [Picosynechococcus sp. OG1]SMQ81267.1 AraC-type DNA-binding protein [Synechococcus sp. 7002]